MIKSIFLVFLTSIISMIPLSQFPVNLCKKNYYWWYYFVIFICFQWYCHVQLQFLAQFKVELFLFPYDPATHQHPIKTMKLCFSEVAKKQRLSLAKLRLIDFNRQDGLSMWITTYCMPCMRNRNHLIVHNLHHTIQSFHQLHTYPQPPRDSQQLIKLILSYHYYQQKFTSTFLTLHYFQPHLHIQLPQTIL